MATSQPKPSASARQALLEQNVSQLQADFHDFKTEQRESSAEVRSLITELRQELAAHGGLDARLLIQVAGIAIAAVSGLWALAIAPLDGKLNDLIQQAAENDARLFETESTRFTRDDGDALQALIRAHEGLEGHPIGMERIAGTQQELRSLLDGPKVRIDQLEAEFEGRVTKQESILQRLISVEVELAKGAALKERVDNLEEDIDRLQERDRP